MTKKKMSDKEVIMESKFLQENFKTGLHEFLSLPDYFWVMARIEAVTANLYQLVFAALRPEKTVFETFKEEIIIGLDAFIKFHENVLKAELKKKELH